MTTSYPGALDALTNPSSGDQLNSPSHAGQHANVNDAIEAMQAAMGVKYGARVKAERTATQSLSSGVDTAIAFNATDAYDTDAFHNPASNNTRLTIPANMGGLYLVVAAARYDTSSAGARRLYLLVNGTTLDIGTSLAAVSSSIQMHIQATGLLVLAAADYIEVMAYQSSGGALAINLASVEMVKIA